MKHLFSTATRSLCLALGLTVIVQAANAQSDRTVALVVSVGEGTARADQVQSQLQEIGAETLRAVNPNNAEVRSVLRRFADESEDARAAFVYLDMPAVTFEGREYVLSDSAGLLAYQEELGRGTDLFTQSIPLLAFARTAALAEQGGAVVIAVNEPETGLPDAVSVVTEAPTTVPGASAIVVVDAANSEPVLQTIAAAAVGDTAVEIGALLRRMVVHDGVTVSAMPPLPIMLREPPASVVVPEPQVPVTAPVPEPEDVEPVVVAVAEPEPQVAQETLEELIILEQSLSRGAKRNLQRRLRDLDHYKGLVDGIFGPQTRTAITEFQTDRTDPPTGVLTRRQLLDLQASG
ncbi:MULTISPECIES: peptidoglycan-binding domain-containing protein [Rhodobacterales]|uniref:peptidoglycan-binding domain-containing protein n=1 Tax=Rhodobacterales TaxID=204455 RepID=UPI0015F11C16|nr:MULTISPECIES: peptidoglycan-binding domain-containing protein [Rhodobacterales]MDO6590535.1 peptidoglycan-binding domain-containing protein [Yoonia sp. 1_MG-2023]